MFHSLYRLNRKFIRDYPAIAKYLERLSGESGFGSSLDIEATKRGYFESWNQPTNGFFVPAGPVLNPGTGVACDN